MFSKEDLKQQMAHMGLKPDDTVMLHSSLRAIGPTENGADGLIDAFCEYLCDGLFLVPTHTWADVNAQHPEYDVRKTMPCIGTLPRVAAMRTDGVRSLHPTHSMWACGKGAHAFVQGEENAPSPTPPGFAWSRLADAGAKILLAGVSHDRNTFIHSIDELTGYPDRLSDFSFPVRIIDQEGRVVEHPMRRPWCSKTRDVSAYYVNFDKPLTEMGAQKMHRLGLAETRVVDARACREIISRIYARSEEDIFTEFCTIPPALYR